MVTEMFSLQRSEMFIDLHVYAISALRKSAMFASLPSPYISLLTERSYFRVVLFAINMSLRWSENSSQAALPS